MSPSSPATPRGRCRPPADRANDGTELSVSRRTPGPAARRYAGVMPVRIQAVPRARSPRVIARAAI
ncbi:hypothetical protein D9V34_17185 [Mycetocola lacteus]|uniref:Uncharacterized protein n=1 Tax=Mycetocola lacteus TaxID=76637 RepID=A0A3L7AHC2_9MICO|nr:hypothetical protein D9V34_17185 [Mycetocola lacteus]